jgi:EAL domain-containing protein (putative c-di-GMP-specific phosphodiesterase class I)
LEIAEQVVLEEVGLGVLRAPDQQGHPLHLYDFGSGMSSLERITRLLLAAKLGQGFMTSLGSIPHAHFPEARILRGLGEALGLDIIVQSMESEAQMGFLLAEGFGFTLGQGYLLGRSAAALDAEIFLGKGKSSCG